MPSSFQNIRVSTLEVEEGDVFFCSRDAERYLNSDIFKKVSLFFCESGFFDRNENCSDLLSSFKDKIVELSGGDFHRKLVSLLKERYPIKSKLIAITGTKGKTSSCWFISQLLQKSGFSCGYIGTLGVYFFNKSGEINHLKKPELTTPNIGDLYINLNNLSNLGSDIIVFEASSHALQQGRLDGLEVDCACFTNLSQDHLDYHGTMNNYFLAKSLLFSQYLKSSGIAILNRNDEKLFQQLFDICNANGNKILSFGENSKCDLSIKSISQNGVIQKVLFHFLGQNFEFETYIIGEFQIYNIILAILSCHQVCDISVSELCDRVQEITAPLGRMEIVKNPEIRTNATFIVDFAHSPKSLEESLLCAKSIYKNVIVVFGCGGDRDKKKRPIMFEIARCIADKVIITTDNPRTEKPEDIIDDIIATTKHNGDNNILNDDFVKAEISNIDKKYSVKNSSEPIVIVDRREAIRFAVENFKDEKDTCVIIAGKGHEDYQIIGTKKTYFSDQEEILKNL